MSSYYFLHSSSGRSWPATNPNKWLLDHSRDDLLAAARERLLASPEDPDRCLRVVLRRCCLALIQIIEDDKIVVRYWRDPIPDVKAWAKRSGFNRPGIQVAFTNVKNNKVVVHEDAEGLLLFGVRVGPRFPWSQYTAKYEMRGIEQQDDQDVAPTAFTNFGWEGVPHGRLTWRVLKSIWRAERIGCPNCDRPLVLTSFGWHDGPLSFRSARVFRHCPRCRRRFEVAEPEPLRWVASVLPQGLRPSHLEQWRTFEIDWSRLAFKHDRPVQFADREE